MKFTAYIVAAAIIIVVGIPYLILSAFSSADEEKSLEDIYSEPISVFLEDQNMEIQVPLEEYVACVVACEMPAMFEEEALKAQAVAARTYGLSRQGSLCDTVHCQVFKTKEEISSEKGQEWMNTYWDKISSAAVETAGQVLYYNGEPASQVLFHSSSGGRTENSEEVFVSAVPYLRSVDSPYEEEATHKNDETVFALENFAEVINGQGGAMPVTIEDIGKMEITLFTTGGRVGSVRIGANEFTGKQIREMFDLPSANFTYRIEGDNIVITTTGYGHGVGMSQYGANGMAKKGYTYDEILKHYYTGTEIKQYKGN
ncbi:MAG: stage II sporulation protein D [Clostridiales bacterium]|nr:stage II sporulation protein D [Clostridiales bacterium]